MRLILILLLIGKGYFRSNLNQIIAFIFQMPGNPKTLTHVCFVELNSPLALRLRQTEKKTQGQLTTGVICQADRGSVNYEVPCCDNLWSKSIKQVLFAVFSMLHQCGRQESLGKVGGTGQLVLSS